MLLIISQLLIIHIIILFFSFLHNENPPCIFSVFPQYILTNRTNHHPGNKRYRKIVEGRKVDYVNSKRLDKPLVALQIIRAWRSQKPPGRFLKLDEKTSLWHDVGNKKAREKTSQALREKAPLLRKQQEDQRKERGVATIERAEKVKVCPLSSYSK